MDQIAQPRTSMSDESKLSEAIFLMKNGYELHYLGLIQFFGIF